MIGKQIDNYKFTKLLGQGTFGTVYLGRHLKTSQEFAIKVIPVSTITKHPQLEKSTIQQIDALSKLRDTTHIVKYIELLRTANNFYFVQEYCNGGTLGNLIKAEGRLKQTKALLYFKQLLDAFRVLHKKNIIHRDVKPENILLHNWVIKLGDFGFCKALNNPEEESFAVLGSPLYMAPEILKGEPYTRKADIWSLGNVLYEMLFGHCLFQQTNIYHLLKAIDSYSLDLNIPENSLTDECLSLLRQMLEKNQFKRIGWDQLLSLNISEEGRILPPIKSIKPTQLNAAGKYSLKEFKKIDIRKSSIQAKNKTQERENFQSQNYIIKGFLTKKSIKEQQENCLKALQLADCFVRQMYSLGLPFAYIILKEIQTRLQQHKSQGLLDQNIELSKVHSNVEQAYKQLTSFDRDLVKTPKDFLKSRFIGESDNQLRLWAKMVTFLKKAKQQPTTRHGMSALVYEYLTA